MKIPPGGEKGFVLMAEKYKDNDRRYDSFSNNTEDSATDIMCGRIMDAVLSPEYKPCTPDELAAFMLLSEDDERAFNEAGYRLENEGRLVRLKRGRIVATENSSYIRGIFRANAKGFGFVTPEESFSSRVSGDLHISAGRTLGAVSGDTVLAAVTGRASDSKNPEGDVVRIISRGITELIGTVEPIPRFPQSARRGTGMCVRPDKPIYPFLVLLDDGGDTLPHIGTSVSVRLTEYPDYSGYASGVITEVFGRSGSTDAVYASIMYEYGLSTKDGGGFSDELISAAKAISERGIAYDDAESRIGGDIDGRRDLRNELIFTLDGADAKDLDDAISVRRDGDGFVLGVHIADVSHYVSPGSPLDNEALTRGTSVYLTDRVVPMLPRPISNGICSLTAGTDRLTLSAIMHIDRDGNTVHTELCESVIHSSLRGVYSEFNDFIQNGSDSEYADKYSVLGDMADACTELYSILERRSRSRGALELETSEAKILLGADGAPTDIKVCDRGIGERMIEQFMLCANEAVATELYFRDMPCVYRIHEDPSPEKIRAFTVFAHNLGLDISPLRAKKIYPTAISNVLAQASEREIGGVVSYVLLRSLMKARYSDKCLPHFGLAIDKYCHFTSPIRRYPDLAVHRFVKAMLRGEMFGERLASAEKFAAKAADMSSDNELRAVSAERAVDDLFKVRYMSSYVGETFDGVVSSVTSFGMFVELPNTCEGLIPITSMDGYFIYDEVTLTLSCGNKIFHLGDKVTVKLISADVVRRKLEFELIGNGMKTSESRAGHKDNAACDFSGRRSRRYGRKKVPSDHKKPSGRRRKDAGGRENSSSGRRRRR